MALNSTPHIFQINVSDGGVPKTAVRQAEATAFGLTGDRHRDLDHHGGPERALCLYSLEKIIALQEEGHPIFPGAAGENLTLAGVDWDLFSPGLRLQLGETVVIEITRFTTPCSSLAPWFIEERIGRISQKQHPGWSRVYARVMQPGLVCVGNEVKLLS